MPPNINVDNPWAAIAAIIIALGWGVREIQQRSAKPEVTNGPVSENRIRALIAEHAVECPAAVRLETEMRALRLSIDNLTQYLLNRKD